MSEVSAKLGSRMEISRIQKLISDRMIQSKRTQPCVYLTARADVTEMSKIRRPLSKSTGVRISTNDFFLLAMAKAVEKYPLFAGVFKGDYVEIADNINIGLAVASPGGLVVPVIKNANQKTLIEISNSSAAIIAKARDGKLSLGDLEGACSTLTALGMFGIDSFLAIPSIDQASILSAGKIIEMAVPGDDGEIVTEKQIEFGLSVDNRIIGAEYAAKFLNEVVEMVESPESLCDGLK